MELSKFEKLFLDQISQIFDVDSIIKEIKSRKLSDCNFLSDADVQYAFLQWLKDHLSSIESDASHFIREKPTHFDNALLRLEQDRLQDEYYAEMYGDGFREISEEEFKIMQKEMDPDYSIEDDFDGTPEEAVQAATYW